MALTALCIRLLTDVVLLLACSSFTMTTDAAFPRVSPDSLQFFEYDAISVSCENIDGSAAWRVMWTHSFNWNASLSLYTVNPASPKHSGEYWCENEKGDRSDAVNITVTAGSVILESPASPAVQGNDLILHCENKKTDHKITDFYKDGVHLRTEYKGIMTITNVSKSDEGLYRCSISGAGTSPESWLTVSNQSQGLNEGSLPSQSPIPVQPSDSPNLLALLWIVSIILLVALLLLLLGLLLWRKRIKVIVCFSSSKSTPGSQSSNEHNPVSGEDTGADPHRTTYAAVDKRSKHSKENVAGDASLDEPNDVTYAVVRNKKNKKELHEVRATIETLSSDERIVYSAVRYRVMPAD